MSVRRRAPRCAAPGEERRTLRHNILDPPYNLGWGAELPELIAANESILADGGVWVFERSEEEEPAPLDAEKWEREDRKYGGTVLSFYTRRND